jgi:hypothetical protein
MSSVKRLFLLGHVSEEDVASEAEAEELPKDVAPPDSKSPVADTRRPASGPRCNQVISPLLSAEEAINAQIVMANLREDSEDNLASNAGDSSSPAPELPSCPPPDDANDDESSSNDDGDEEDGVKVIAGREVASDGTPTLGR